MQNVIIIGGVVIVLGVIGLMFLGGEPDEQAPVTMPPTSVEQADVESGAEGRESEEDIIDIAVQTDSVSTLITAVTAGELVETLQGEGPFTVFAPVNEAFASLPAGTVETLLMPDNIADLQSVLTYHVVPGRVLSSDLTDGMLVTTVQGEEITISLNNGGVMINDNATVIVADMEASNGVIHLIDAVLLP